MTGTRARRPRGFQATGFPGGKQPRGRAVALKSFQIAQSSPVFPFAKFPPLALYVHLPWCVRKCPYCDFNSHAVKPGRAVPEEDYVAALLRDLDHDRARLDARPLQSVFLGGGTPSLFAPPAIAQLLAGLRARLALAPDVEITLEANPGTVDAARLAGFRAAGVNRLSLGVQSFDDAKLRALGRIHDAAAAVHTVHAARAAGFDNLNLDLMFGLPGQDCGQALADLDAALALAPEHLSLYQLTLEPNTAFHRSPPPLPDEDAVWDMQLALQGALAAAGYAQYEVSAYARPGRACRHNLNYWQFGDYLGIGAGAHAKLTDRDGIARRWKVRHPADYMRRAGTPAALGGDQRLAPADAALEFMMNALRLTDGVAATLFTERTGLPLAFVAAQLRAAEARGLLVLRAGHVRATATGARYLNDLLGLFLPEAA